MHEGVDVEISKGQKDELTITGNSLENVSQSAADIQQICRVRNKDIRKVSLKSVDHQECADYCRTVLGWSLRVGEDKHRGRGIGIRPLIHREQSMKTPFLTNASRVGRLPSYQVTA